MTTEPADVGGALEIVFAVDDTYAFGAAVSAMSIRKGVRDARRPIRFRIVDGGLTEAGRSFVETEVGRAGDVEICEVANRLLLPEKVKYLTSATLGRLHLADVVPAHVSRVIYLDADTLVLGDLTELFRVDLGGGWIGAVLNEMSATRSVSVGTALTASAEGAPPPGYFNDGMLVVDMDAWRANSVTERAREIFERFRPELRSWLDQDILNIVFAGRWTRLPDEWNKLIDHSVHGKCGAGRFDYLVRREGIVHYVGSPKPWEPEFPANPLRRLYDEFRAENRVPWFDGATAAREMLGR
jgi:lipopolysaccharide biosynthesis glycosyltransferase